LASYGLDVRIAGMRDLDRQYRITARSVPEVVGPMEQALSRYGMSRRTTFRGRKLSNEAFINAALLHLLNLAPDEQERALGVALGQLEQILSLPDEMDSPPSGVVHGYAIDPETGEHIVPKVKRSKRA
jgi:hypothetical protein